MNQDIFCVHRFDDRQGFAVVCDGMGGQSAGNIASEMTCRIVADTLIAAIAQNDACEAESLLSDAVKEANRTVYTRSVTEAGLRGMGTTIVAAVVREDTAYCAHVGDSRIYLFRDGILSQLTRDHSLVWELMEKGEITPEEMRTHPNRNMITRAVGVSLRLDVDTLSTALLPGDKLLLCSDGLTSMVEDSRIAALLRAYGGQYACDCLIEEAKKAGGTDNITAAVIE